MTASNSVLGEAANGGAAMNFAYDSTYYHLIVGRPADNKVTVVIPAYKIYLPFTNKE